MSEDSKNDSGFLSKLSDLWERRRAEEAATMCAKREPTESEIDRAMVIGKWFCGWTEATGPCPIAVTNGHWGKKLCALFEWIAVLETESAGGGDAPAWRSASAPPTQTEWVVAYADGRVRCVAWNNDSRKWEDWDKTGLDIECIDWWMPITDRPATQTPPC